MGKLIVCRHGQTPYNANKLMTGIADPELTEKGEEQAKDLGRDITVLEIDYVYASTLRRAFNTASLALEESVKHQHLPVEKRPEIIEQDVGVFTGRNYKNDPAISLLKREFDRAHPHGESFADVVKRIGDFYQAEVKPRIERDENVLVVCHSGVLRAFQYIFDTEDGAKERCFNGSIPNAEPWVVDFDDQAQVQDKYYLSERRPANNNTPQTKPSQTKTPQAKPVAK